MALALLRVRNCFNSPAWKQSFPVISSLRFQSSATEVQQRPGENYVEKNERLKRPLSPHLTIYKFQVTSVLSITHRMTGLALSGGLYGLSLGMLVLPSSFPHYMEYLHDMSLAYPLIFSLKFSLAWMFIYHSLNGVRHLAWDLGYGYELRKLYMSGYGVLGISLALSALVAFL